MINRDFKSAFFAATFFLVGLASMADVLAQNGATLKFALPNLLRNERQVVAVIDKPLTGKLDLDFSHQVLVLDQAVDPSAIDYFLITTSDADSEQVAYWENVVDGVTQTYLFNAKHLSMRTAIEVDEFTNRTLIAHNLEAEFQGAWIEIKTSTSSIKVMMTPIALGEILNSHWREFLVSCLK